jgi:hypothetical protein
MIQQIIKQRYFLVISRFVSVFLHSSKVAAADESPPVLALYRISRSERWRQGKNSMKFRKKHYF